MPAAAQEDAGVLVSPEGQSAVVEELQVVARPPGPALWRVTKGAGEVVILGGLSPLPHLLQWRSPRLDRAMADARQVLLPPRARVTPLDAPGLLLRYPALRAKSGDMTGGLPADLRQRFFDVAAGHGMDAARYRKWKPGVAGFMMLADFREKAGLSSAKPGSTIARQAKAAGIPAKPIDDYSPATLLKSAARLSDQAHRVCLAAALDEIAVESSRARPAAEAWANGDLAGVRANAAPAVLDACLQQTATYNALLESGTAKAVRDIERALGRDGRTVAVIEMKYLLRANGVLDRLRAQGAQITVPGEETVSADPAQEN